MIEHLPGQQDLPGCEPAPMKARVGRQAAAPLKPSKAQKPCDQGLFGDQAAQVDLLDLVNSAVALEDPAP